MKDKKENTANITKQLKNNTIVEDPDETFIPKELSKSNRLFILLICCLIIFLINSVPSIATRLAPVGVREDLFQLFYGLY